MNMTVISSILYLFMMVACSINGIDGFSSRFYSVAIGHNLPIVERRTHTVLKGEVYGRGAEIWPECNMDAVRLADSFPNGQIPPIAALILDKTDMGIVHGRMEDDKEDVAAVSSRRRRFTRPIRRILHRAAAREELNKTDGEGSIATVDRTPAVVAVGLIARGLLRPLDLLVVSALTAYFAILGLTARSPRDTSDVPTMPATPPQGHVPIMVANPMGVGFGSSKTYESWLKLGVAFGLIGPLLMMSRYIAIKNMDAARACARPIFLLCCQAITEAYSRKLLAPLPIRILVPVAYSVIRLAYLWIWATAPCTLGYAGRGLASASVGYWAINLFAFLLPVATMRYMRAHFFCVEAAEVTTRTGLEDSIGILPK